MAYDITMLTYTPDLRYIDHSRARIVCAMRYSHIAKAKKCYSAGTLANRLGSMDAVKSFHVFMDEAGRAWPEPISLNPPCQPAFSYDEMLLADLCIAAARNDRTPFEQMIEDMLAPSARNALWAASTRLMRNIAAVAR